MTEVGEEDNKDEKVREERLRGEREREGEE